MTHKRSMRPRSYSTSSMALRALTTAVLAAAPAQQAWAQLYWDINGATSGAGGTSPSGTWDQVNFFNWNSSSLGTNAGTTWAAGNTAIFSAGADAVGTFTITIPNGVVIPGVNGITYDETPVGATTTITGGAGSGIVLTSPNINTLGTHTIAASIGGTVGLSRVGGILGFTLSGSNSYTGVTTINTNGRVIITNSNALGSSAAADKVVFNPLAATTNTFTGMGLSLVGDLNVNKSIEINGGSGGSGLGQLVSLSGNSTWSGTVTLSGGASGIGTGLAMIGVESGTLNVTGPIVGGTGVAAFAKSGAGTMILSGANTYGGITRVFGGTLVVPADVALGATAATDFGIAVLSGAAAYLPSSLLLKPASGDLNYTTSEGVALIAGTPFVGRGLFESLPGATGTGSNLYSGQIALANNAPFGAQDTNVVQPTQINVVGTLTMNSNAAAVGGLGTGNGAITNSSQTNQRYLQKIGSGDLRILTSSTWAGPTSIDAGTLTLAANGVAGGLSAISSTITVSPGASLRFDNTDTAIGERVSHDNVQHVRLYGGDLTITGQVNNSPAAPVVTNSVGGSLDLHGTPTITMLSPGPQGTVLNLRDATVVRQSNATVVFRGPSLGGTVGANVSTVRIPDSLSSTLVPAPGGTGPAISILPWAIGDASGTGGGTDFVTYDTSDLANSAGVRLLTGGEYTNNAINGATANNHSLSTPSSITNPTTVNAIKFASGGTSLAVGNQLTVTSGAILNASGGAVSISGAGTVQFNAQEGVIHAVSDVSVTAPIAGTGGLTKGSGGNLTLGSTLNDFGTLTIDGGTVSITDTAQLGPSSNTVVFNGGFLKPSAAISTLSHNVRAASNGGYDIAPGQTLTASANMQGAGTLEKRGGGTLILSGDNGGFNGAHILSAGTLEINQDNNLGSGSSNSVDHIAANSLNIFFNGGALRVASGQFDLSSERAFVFNAAVGTIDIAAGANIKSQGYLYGAGGLVKTGGGTLILQSRGGAQSKYIGNTVVLGGGLIYADTLSQNFTPPVAIPDYWALDNNASISFNFNTAANRGMTLRSGGGSIFAEASGSAPNAGNFSFGGLITGSGALTKTGNGTLVLGVNNDYQGGTIIKNGYLLIAAGGRLGAANTQVTLDGGTLAFSTAVGMGARPIVVGSNNGTLDTQATGAAANNTGAAITGVGTLGKYGSNQFSTESFRVGGLNVDSGTFSVNSGRNPTGKVSTVGTLNLNTGNGAILNLNNNDLIYNYDNTGNPTAADPQKSQDIRGLLASGFANPASPWTGTNGITSGTARTDNAAATPVHTAIGYAEAASAGISGTYDGQAVDANTVVLRYTYFGDANLDGKVNALDFNALASNFGPDTNQFWVEGDFDYDGDVDTNDFNALSQNFNAAAIAGALPSAPLGALVPEPTGLGALALGATALLSRRRRK